MRWRRSQRANWPGETLIATGTSTELPALRHWTMSSMTRLMHEVAQPGDQAGFLGHRNEARRRNVAVGRMFPTHQRFEGHDAAGLDVDQRLIVHVELALRFQRGAQARFDGDALLQLAVHHGAEHLEVVPAAILGLIHRCVGVAEQRAHVFAVAWEHAHADAGGCDQRLAVDLQQAPRARW